VNLCVLAAPNPLGISSPETSLDSPETATAIASDVAVTADPKNDAPRIMNGSGGADVGTAVLGFTCAIAFPVSGNMKEGVKRDAIEKIVTRP
jgi:hypothetical protein